MPVIINGTTGISGVDGSAGTPSYQGNDTNTGIFYPAADTIAFAEGGAEIARFDSSGNFGINTTSPGVKLGVVDTSAGTITFPAIFGNRGTTNSTEVFFGLQTYDSGGAGITNGISSVTTSNTSSAGSADLKFWTTNSATRAERMRITSAGDIGIGTSSPNGRVTIGNNATDTALSGTSNTQGLHLYARNFGISQIDSLVSGSSNSGMSLRTYNNGTYTEFIANDQGNTTRFQTAGAERMRINSTGGVSIGTTTALATLTVNGNITPVQAPNSNWGIDFAPSTATGSFVTLANDATYDLAAGSGLVYVYDNAGNGAAQYFSFFGSTSVTNLTGGFFAAVINTAGKVNFYYESGVARYRFQNKTGSTVNLFISTIRLRASA